MFRRGVGCWEIRLKLLGKWVEKIRKPNAEIRKNSESQKPNRPRQVVGMSLRIRIFFGILEATAKAAPLWYSHALFPLTPALSLREREHHRQRIRQSQPLGVVTTRSLVLPLPEGEGRGEGERALQSADRGTFAIGSRLSNFGLHMNRTLPWDWYSGTVPENVLVDPTAYVETTYSFVMFRSQQAQALQVGRGTSLYLGVMFDLGQNA